MIAVDPEQADVRRGIAARDASLDHAAIGQPDVDGVVLLDGVIGGDDEILPPDHAGGGDAASGVNGDDDARGPGTRYFERLHAQKLRWSSRNASGRSRMMLTQPLR